jgi:hypothetical protein
METLLRIGFSMGFLTLSTAFVVSVEEATASFVISVEEAAAVVVELSVAVEVDEAEVEAKVEAKVEVEVEATEESE